MIGHRRSRVAHAAPVGIAAVLALAGTSWAICSGFGAVAPPPPSVPPAGEVPPDSRDPGDPPPPPETGGPVTGGGDVGGPITGGGAPGGPVTGGGAGSGPVTGGGGGGTLGPPPTGGGTRPPGTPSTGGARNVGHWSYWWYANRALLLGDARVRRTLTVSDRESSSAAPDTLWRAGVRAALAQALSSDEEEVVAAAVLSLGKGGDAADIPVVSRVALDADRGPPEREHAAIALGLLRAETPADALAARTALETIASDDASSVRLRALAILALGMRRDEAAVPFLMDCARSGGRTWDVPAAGLTALGLSGCEAARQELERLLAPATRNDETMRRVYAAHGLAKLGDQAALPALVAALVDETNDVRRAAALAIGAVSPAGDRTAVRALQRVLEKDKDRGVQSMAAVSLGRVGGEEALVALRAACDDGDASVRPFAAIGIGLLARDSGRPRLVAPLLRDLKRGARQELRGATCVAVGLAGLTDAAPALRAIIEEGGNPEILAHAALALGLIGDGEKDPEMLRKVLHEAHDPVLRGEVARALGMLDDLRTLADLDDMAEQGRTEHERIVGCLGLGRVGGSQCAVLLMNILADEKKSHLERHMAGNALGLLLDESEGRRTGAVAADLNWHLFTPTVIDVLTEM